MRLGLAVTLLSAAGFAAVDTEPKAFTLRVENYAKIRKTAIDKVPILSKTATPEEIVNHENALVTAIRLARPAAKQGDIFTPESLPLFASILKNNMAGPRNAGSRKLARQGNPKHEDEPGEAQPVIQVNAIYPKSAPVSTMPPKLLLQLPPLPKNVEYRFVGKTLILYDSLSNLIIDYLPGAAPAL